MASTPPKPNPKPITNKPSCPCISSITIPLEPSSNLLPSSIAEFSNLITVVVVAATVAFSCNYVFTSLNHQPILFCDTNPDFDDSLSVEGSLSSSGNRKKAKESRLASGQHAEVSLQQRNWPWKAKEPVKAEL